MNAQQKDAIYCIVLSSISLVVFLILMIFLGEEVAFSAFAIFGLYGLTPWIFYRKSKEKTIVDERDFEIGKKAGSFAFGLFWIVFVLVAVLIPLIKGFRSSIPVSLLFYILMFGVILIYVGRSIRILMLYRQGRAE
ncbi:MAG: DUF2178 domain-containing protein [Bacteroidetes bacterium]|nr:DUF2178 domain-containing protein [Bacteroidota bacterium]